MRFSLTRRERGRARRPNHTMVVTRPGCDILSAKARAGVGSTRIRLGVAARCSGKRELELPTPNPRSVHLFLILTLLLRFPTMTHAAVGGSISGTVKDHSGAVVPKATVTATNTDTGVRQVVTTNGTGSYSFPSLPVGHYDVNIAAAGFKPYQRASITVDVNGNLFVDAVLELGESSEAITVKASIVEVDTASTQLGDVVGGGRPPTPHITVLTVRTRPLAG